MTNAVIRRGSFPTHEMQYIGEDQVSGRRLFLVEVSEAQARLPSIEVRSARFVTLLVWDAAGAPDEQVGELVQPLLDAGCVYSCTWGVDCERVHDVIDLLCVVQHPSATSDAVVLTTWHANESLDDALYYGVTRPAADYVDSCRAGLVVAVGGDANRLARIRYALENTAAFIREVLENE